MNRSMMDVSFPLFIFSIVTMLTGCEVGPNYSPPKPDVPDHFSTTQPTAELTRWWETFHDPELNALVARAVHSNLDLKLATARIMESRQQRDVVNSSLFPEVDADGSYERAQISKSAGFLGFGSVAGAGSAGGGSGAASAGSTSSSGNGTLIAPKTDLRRKTVLHPAATTTGGAGAGSAAALGIPDRFDLWQAGFDARWEVDIFGGVRRSLEAATADIQAQEESRRDTLLTLLGDVARNYVQVRGLQREIRIALENIHSQQQTVELTRSRFQAGLANDLDVAAEAQVATSQATVPTLRTELRQSLHRLGVLLGQPPESLVAELTTEGPIPPPPAAVPIGLPSDLLRRRPDVRRAERQLAASSARIGVATADLFPRFSLTGGLGLESQRFKDLARSDSVFYNIGPSISWPIIDFGRIQANIRVQNARQQEAMVQYRQAVLTSLEDVENALTAYAQEQQRHHSLEEAVDANRRAVDLANQLYTKGLVDFLNVLEAQRNLFAAQDQLIQSEQLVSADIVSLYKALGGGWEELQPEPAASPKSTAQKS